MSQGRRVASVLVAGMGLLFLVPPIYATIADWRGAANELAWTHLWDMLPCCSVPAVLCFFCARRIRHPRRNKQYTHPMKPRRWLRFGLRTFFVLLTLVVLALGWLGMQFKWIRDRQDARTYVGQHGYIIEDQPIAPRRLAWTLAAFGERPVRSLTLEAYTINDPDWHSDPVYSNDKKRLQRLFPETYVDIRW